MARAGQNGMQISAAMLRRINTARVLSRLRLAGEISRADLARESQLDPKTITNLIKELMARRLVTGGEAVASGRGRPAERLSIHPDAAFAVGLDLGAQQISGVILDLRGRVRHQWREVYGIPRDSEFLLGRAREAITTLLAALSRTQRARLEGIGFVVPGFLDRRAGVAVQSVNIPGLQNVPVAELMSASFGVPVLLEEASRARALAEHWFGRHGAVDHLVCVDLGYGIGMGIIHQGVLYRGTRERSGEIGHTVVEFNGTPCRCGKRGCLETVASGRALHEIAASMLGPAEGPAAGAQALHAAALDGDERARRVLERTGEYLGMAIANVANLLDPDLVVLCGGLTEAGAMLIDPLRQAVAAHRIGGDASPVRIELSTLGPLSGAMGAAMVVLRHHFEIDGIRPQVAGDNGFQRVRPPASAGAGAA